MSGTELEFVLRVWVEGVFRVCLPRASVSVGGHTGLSLQKRAGPGNREQEDLRWELSPPHGSVRHADTAVGTWLTDFTHQDDSLTDSVCTSHYLMLTVVSLVLWQNGNLIKTIAL